MLLDILDVTGMHFDYRFALGPYHALPILRDLLGAP